MAVLQITLYFLRAIDSITTFVSLSFMWSITVLYCCLCEKRFYSKQHLKVHIQSAHEGKRFKCNSCEKEFKSNSILRKHNLIHDGVSFACNSCDKKFSRREMLREHEQSFHKGKRLKCDPCEIEFTFLSSLKRHQKNFHSWFFSVKLRRI